MKEQKGRKNTIRKEKKQRTQLMTSSVFGKIANSPGVGGSVRDVIDGSFLTKETMVKYAPFLMTLAGLAFIYISINYYADKTLIKIERTKEEVKELRFEYITTKSQLTQFTQASNVSKVLEAEGIKQSLIPPRKIFINKNEKK